MILLSAGLAVVVLTVVVAVSSLWQCGSGGGVGGSVQLRPPLVLPPMGRSSCAPSGMVGGNALLIT